MSDAAASGGGGASTGGMVLSGLSDIGGMLRRADLEKTFSPVSRTTNSACEQTERESTPQRLKWRLQCTGQLDMDVAGEFLFETPERYTATLITEAWMQGQRIQRSHVTIEAERVGDCP